MNTHAVWIVVTISVVTVALRFLPFLIFNGKRKTPEHILYLGRVLPPAIMGMLVIYCLRDMSFAEPVQWLPAVTASVLVAVLYGWKRNSLISIIGGTAFYMAMLALFGA